jgi:3-dehydroquinate synthase
MGTLTVDLGERSYPIHVTPDLPARHVAKEARRIREGLGPIQGAPVLLVSDTNVGPLYAADVAAGLEAEGFRVIRHTVEAGERSKTLDTVAAVLDVALGAGLGRRDLVVALGGGVVGDISGFAAAILHRGVALIQVPTTLLAQVDSAVGGKTGVNHRLGKNLIGAFWQPRSVVASHAVLATLPDRERRCGLAEAIKHGFIADRTLVDRFLSEAASLERLEPEPTMALIEACCRIKAAIVASDEREAGDRAVLNFGHTLGHAYERLLGYGELTHGEAVSLGMVHAARVSENIGASGPGLAERVVSVLSAAGLPVDTTAPGLPSIEALLEAARSDKKADGDTIRFVVLEEVGRSLIERLTWDELADALASPV